MTNEVADLITFFFFEGTTPKRRNAEIKRLNDVYNEIIPLKNTLTKCIKYLCQTEPYRMLKNWSYEIHADPLESDEPPGTPDFLEVLFLI